MRGWVIARAMLWAGVLATPARCWATAGDLDPTFGSGGIVRTSIGSGTARISAIVLEPDGKLVVAGAARNATTYNYDVLLMRYNADGSLDDTFGSGGIVMTTIGRGSGASALVRQPDGRLVVAGYSSNVTTGNDFTLVRYHPDGALDGTFGDGGIVRSPIVDRSDGASALVLQPDGKLVAAGSAEGRTQRLFAVARYNADGAPDTMFGNGGKVTTRIGTEGDYARALVRQPDGKLVVAGESDFHFALVRYTANGTLDATFGSSGKVTTHVGSTAESAEALALRADGKLIAAGYTYISGTFWNFALARYNPEGSLDASFGTGGTVTTTTPTTTLGTGFDFINALVLLPDGKLVAAGRTDDAIALLRYHPDGTLDPTFGDRGIVLEPPGEARAVALQFDGKLVAAGASRLTDAGALLARYIGGVCGDGTVTSGEACDDSNAVDGDGCDSNCTLTACGNGVVTAPERCDDGNLVDGDGCNANCTPTGCGDGLVGSSEECDDGNGTSGDGCDANCTLTRCGNGIVTAGEACDDGNTAAGDACLPDCTINPCGDGVVSAGEECDDGNYRDGDGCDANCTRTRCGNGILTAGEQCDDGNARGDDECKNDCTRNLCGDGVVRSGVEECDDHNLTACDGCSATCETEAGFVCGDGVVSSACGEQCDDGAANSDTQPDACRTNCRGAACGDGVRDRGETCDDGNLDNCDGCADTCAIDPPPLCGDGVANTRCNERCDDGNVVGGDACSETCQLEFIAGGGGKSADCFTEWSVVNPHNQPLFDRHGRHVRKQVCRDNDPACDFDSGVGACGFRVTICMNVADPGLPTCAPASLGRWEILRPSADDPAAVLRAQFLAEGDALLRQPFGACSLPLTVGVALKNTATGLRSGRRVLRTRTTAASGRRDTDALTFMCTP